MIKILSLFLVLTGALALATQPPVAPSAPPAAYHPAEYYFTIDLDPRYQIVGTGALSEEDAANAKCYRFLYNSNGKLQQIEYRVAGKAMADPFFGVARIDFEYQPGIERRWYRDAQSQPVADLDGVQGEELTLNPAGFPTDVTNLDATGGRAHDSSGVLHYVRTLDDHNRLVVGRRIGLFGTAITDDNGWFESRTVYDRDGRVSERGNYDASGALLNNNDGVALVRTIYTIYPDSTETISSYFDASSLAVEEKSTGVHQCQTTVDKRGLLLDEAYFDSTGTPTDSNGDGVHERRYTYDERGNILSESFFDGDGKPIDSKTGNYAAVTYKYDAKNRIIEKDYFGDDGKPQVLPNLGAAIVRQEYDERGDLVRREFLDGQGHPSLHPQYLAPAIRIKVDGDTTLVTLRDGKDHPVKNPVSGYYAFSYKTATDKPLSPTNLYYDRHGRLISFFPRVKVINPHIHALSTSPVMEVSARLGATAAALGALLGGILALIKSSHTKRRKVYIPSPLERFLGWFSVFCIIEGTLRFFMTVYWSWVIYQNGRMGHGIYIVEMIVILFFLYRLSRLRLTMRVLNIGRDDMHRLVREFFAKANLKPEWVDSRNRYLTEPLDIRVNYFRQKYHAYLAFASRGHEGHELAHDAAEYIREQSASITAPVRSRTIAFYYPMVAISYFLLSGTGFYTVYQLIKGF